MISQHGPLNPPPPVNLLPIVGRIQGAMLVPAKTPQENWVTIQYLDPQDKLHQMNVPFLDAMYLLNLLKAVQSQSSYKMPDDPFAKKS